MSDTDTIAAEAEQIVADPKADSGGSIEARAREMGWVPKDEWKGDPSKHRSAEEFVKFGEGNLGVLKKENAELRKAIEELKGTVTQMTGWMSKKEREGYERALAEIEAKRKDAVASGDVKAFDAAEAELKKLEKTVDKAADNPATDAYKQWADKPENRWYGDDVDATIWADTAAPMIAKKAGWDGKSPFTVRELNAVTEAVLKKFPHLSENPRRTAPGATEGARPTLAGKGAKAWDDIPAEERRIIQSQIGPGAGKIFKDTAAAAKAYWAEYGDKK